MKMREAFKRLLDGEKITRPEWGEKERIEYCQAENRFKVFSIKFGNLVFYYADTVEMDTIYKESEKEVHVLSFIDNDNDRVISLYDDDKNEIYVSKEEKMELDAMRWRLYCHCYKHGDCDECCLEGKCVSDECLDDSELNSLCAKEVKRLYDLIKGEE